jgi:hypothetical protein
MIQVASSKLNHEGMWGGSVSKDHRDCGQDGHDNQEDNGSSSSSSSSEDGDRGGCSSSGGCGNRSDRDCSDGSDSDDGSSSSGGTNAWQQWGVLPAGACLEVLSAATEVLDTMLLLNPSIREQQQQQQDAQLPALLLHQINPKLQQQQQMQEQLPVLLLCTAVAGLRVFGAEGLRLVDAAVSVLAQLMGTNEYDPPSIPSCT